MSTSWNLDCPTHPTAGCLLDDDIQGRGDYGARVISEIWRQRQAFVAVHDLARAREVEINIWSQGWASITPRMLGFLCEHSQCDVELRNEYGDRRAVDLTPLPPKHCATCTCPPR